MPTEDSGVESWLGFHTDVAWEQDGNKAIVVCTADGGGRHFSWIQWTPGGGWSPNPGSATDDTNYPAPSDDVAVNRLFADPNVNKMMNFSIDIDGRVKTRNWTGSSWTGGTTMTSLTSNWTVNTNHPWIPVGVAFDRHDIETPIVTDNQSGDDTWRKDNTTLYDVDFDDTGGSKISRFQTKVTSQENQHGILVDDWRDVITGINADSYTTNWQLHAQTWTNLMQGTNYVSVRVYDGAGNNDEITDVFYVKKDIGLPVIGQNQSGDDSWRISSGTTYDIDFNDSLSTLDNAQYIVYSSSSMLGTQIVDWTTIFSSLDQVNYLTDWEVDFASLQGGLNWVSVEVYDNAGNVEQLQDAFYILKDTSPPQITDLQTGDTTWRRVLGTTYNVNFDDTVSLLQRAEYTIWTGESQTGVKRKDWTTIFTSTGTSSYSDDWEVDFVSLIEGATNWISVRSYDIAGSSSIALDVFTVFKDTTPPSVVNNQSGDDSNDGIYDVNFTDSGGSLLDHAQYKICSSTGSVGVIVDWYTFISTMNVTSYTTDWSITSSHWDLLSEGESYVSVRTYDHAGDVDTEIDAFYIRKSTASPSITDSQDGDDTWRKDNSAVYDINFDWGGVALLDSFKTRVSSSPNQGGTLIDDWRTILSSMNVQTYTTDWQISLSREQIL